MNVHEGIFERETLAHACTAKNPFNNMKASVYEGTFCCTRMLRKPFSLGRFLCRTGQSRSGSGLSSGARDSLITAAAKAWREPGSKVPGPNSETNLPL